MRRIPYFAALLAFGAASALAQGDDPPARVARLNYTDGPVSFRPDSVDEWAAAAQNYPLTTGDHLWTDPSARAEMHIGSTAVGMAPGTALAILNLDDRVAQLSVTAGSVNIHIRYLAPDETFEVDTPNIAIALLRPGDYRIDSDDANATTAVTVWNGQAEANGAGEGFPIQAGETARIAGLDNPSHDTVAAYPPNEFDEWRQARDRREDAAQVSAHYVPREMVGYEDLDGYGRWVNVPPYGWVWQPNAVPAGWGPYRYGHWAWVDPWGWTWIDDAPWGFAPFHYGRWAFAGGVWVWVPGRMMPAARPVYAPALVAFVGVGGVGVQAWFPLGPGEVYVPAYHVSPSYVERINIVHVASVEVIHAGVANVHYVNMGVRGAVVAVPREAFVGARPVARIAVAVPEREVVNARVLGATATVAPQRESVLAGAMRSGPPAGIAGRTVVVRRTPPPAAVPFAARQQALEANHGRPLEPAQMNSLRTAAPARNPMVRQAGAPGGPSRPNAVRNDRPPSAVHPGQPASTVESRPAENRGERPADAPRKEQNTRKKAPPKRKDDTRG